MKMAITPYDHEELESNAHSCDEEKNDSVSTTSVNNCEYHHCPPNACMKSAQTGNDIEDDSILSRSWSKEVAASQATSDEITEKCGVAAVDGQRLSRQHKLNLMFCLLAWACTACTHTMSKYRNS